MIAPEPVSRVSTAKNSVLLGTVSSASSADDTFGDVRKVVAVVGSLLLGGGCGLFPGVDDLHGGYVILDGSTETGDASGDALEPVADASVDAQGMGDAAGDGGCSGTFCDDFDDTSRAFLSGWDLTASADEGKLTRYVADPKSRPYGLLATVPKSANDKFPAAFVVKKLSFSKVTASFSVRILTRLTTNECSLFQIHQGTTVRLHQRQADVALREDSPAGTIGGTNAAYPTDVAAIPNAWTRIVVVVDSRAKRTSLSIDGIEKANASLLGTWTPGMLGEVRLGEYYCNGGTTGWEVAYDDFSLVAEP